MLCHININQPSLIPYLLTLCLLFIIYCLRNVTRSPLAGKPVPDAPGSWPIIGHALQLHYNPSQLLSDCFKVCGGIFRIRIFTTECVVVADPVLVSRYLEQPDTTLSLSHAVLDLGFDWTVFDAHFMEFDETKNMFSRMAREAKRPRFIEMVERSGHAVVDRLQCMLSQQQSPTLNLLEEMCNFMTHGTLSCFAPFEFNADQIKEISNFYQYADNLMMGHILFPKWFLKLVYGKTVKAKKNKIVSYFVKQVRKFRECPSETSLIKTIIASHRSNIELTDELIAMYMIGFIYTSSSNATLHLANIILELARPQNAVRLEAIRQECSNSADDLIKLFHAPALDSFVLETARITSNILTSPRIVMDENFRLGEYYLGPKGTALKLAGLVVQTGQTPSQAYHQPKIFKPERFEENQEPTGAPNFLTWGGGRHSCPGKELGIKQVKIAISQLVLNFNFEICGQFPEISYVSVLSFGKFNAQIKISKIS